MKKEVRQFPEIYIVINSNKIGSSGGGGGVIGAVTHTIENCRTFIAIRVPFLHFHHSFTVHSFIFIKIIKKAHTNLILRKKEKKTP